MNTVGQSCPMRVEVEHHCNEVWRAFVNWQGMRWRLAFCKLEKKRDGSDDYGIVKGHHGLNSFELRVAEELLQEELGRLRGLSEEELEHERQR